MSDFEKKVKYEEIFQRNIGVFTQEEQDHIKGMKIAIAGAGGLGGMAAYMLARLGVGEIRICDPESFDTSNINRQFGSYVDTVGQNKAVVVSRELRRINPEINLITWDYGLNKENVEEFIDGADVIIDGIDFYCLEDALALHETARKKNIFVMVSQIAGSMASYIYIKPGNPNFGDLFFDENGLNQEKMLRSLFPVLPKEATGEIIEKILAGEKVPIPSWAHAPIVTALFLVEDLVSYFIKKDKELPLSPKVQLLDLDTKRFWVE